MSESGNGVSLAHGHAHLSACVCGPFRAEIAELRGSDRLSGPQSVTIYSRGPPARAREEHPARRNPCSPVPTDSCTWQALLGAGKPGSGDAAGRALDRAAGQSPRGDLRGESRSQQHPEGTCFGRRGGRCQGPGQEPAEAHCGGAQGPRAGSSPLCAGRGSRSPVPGPCCGHIIGAG